MLLEEGSELATRWGQDEAFSKNANFSSGGATMLNQKISRRSFMTVSAMTAMALALDWKKISAYAARMGDKKDYPVVVIGAGLGGLCCGA
jgi:hypothetical protein